MKEKDAKVYTTSVKNITKKLEYYGDANIENISLLRLIYKYAEYCVTYEQLQRLNSMVNELQRSDSDICLEYQSNTGYTVTTVPVVVVGIANRAPTLTDNSVQLTDPNTNYVFTYEDMYENYTDPEGGQPSGFSLSSLPASGTLYYDNVLISETGGFYTDPTLLVYERDSNIFYVTSFTYVAFDDNDQVPLSSNVATMGVNVEAITGENEPAVIGDRAQYSDNRATTVFSVADFTTRTILPYFDPENNDLDAIRIDEVSTANEGTYYFFGSEVVVGQIITAAELNLGAFYHIAPDTNAVSTDSFNASVRDTGSMIWVQ